MPRSDFVFILRPLLPRSSPSNKSHHASCTLGPPLHSFQQTGHLFCQATDSAMESVLQPSAADQLEGLHPSLPITTRFCVVGGGPSGLSAAYALVKLGYKNVTVLEKHHSVGGMCESVDIEGFTYDLGGQVVARESAPTIMGLADEMKIEMQDLSDHVLGLIDCSNKSYEHLQVAKDYISIMPLTSRLQAEAEKSGKMGLHAVSPLASDLSEGYVKSAGLRNGVPPSVAIGYTASGYGFVQDMPYAYLHEFTRTSMLGKLSRVKTGYASLWKRIAERLPCVLCDSEVVRIDRDRCNVINVLVKVKQQPSGQIQNEELQFDKLIVSGALACRRSMKYRSSAALPDSAQSSQPEVMDFTAEERELFSKVRVVEYYTTVLKISGLNLPKGFYHCKRYVEDPFTIGHPVAIQRFHEETDIYLFWSYGNSEVDQEKMTRMLYEDVKSMGGRVEEVILQRKWDYFPHVCSADMQAGFHDKLENLQGKSNTLYVGALLAFELTERNAAYSMTAVAKHFASVTKKFHYVKKLFELPLQVEDKPYAVEEQSELPGVEFPDLPNLEAYLRFWAKHPVVGNRPLYKWLNDEGKEIDELTYAELDHQASVIAHQLLTLKPSVKRGDRVLLIYPPGLAFVATFFGVLRAGLLPVPLIPPDPKQRTEQALAKVEIIATITEPKFILSTASYHFSVNLAGFRNPFSRKTNPQWPNLQWHHTDSWIAKKKTKGARGFFVQNETSSPTQLEWAKPPLPPASMKVPMDPNLETSVESDSKAHASSAVMSMSRRVEQSERSDLEEEIEASTPKPDDLCFLQFTSGSTGDPKGVMITHGGLIHNVKLMRSAYKSTSRTVLVSWLPQYHDMGLIGGLFTALVSGGIGILFSPVTFIRKPLLWLETMSKYRATHSAGPNFAFELLVRRYCKEESTGQLHKFDLSSLRFLMISAEPVRIKAVKNFAKMLQSSGLKEQTLAPGYGLAENCVFVCCAWGHGQPITVDSDGRVCCGYVRRGHNDIDIRIANPETCEEVAEGQEGEVWVSSPSNGAGYWRVGDKAFQNNLKVDGEINTREYLRTGDLGKVVEGNLFITGRIKDMIIVQGRNIYPADMEKTVEDCCDSVRPGCCAVFGAPQATLQSMGISSSYSSDGIGIVVVAEVKNTNGIVEDEVREQIQSILSVEHGVEVARVALIKPHSICKTSSGKIRRFECLKQFSEGKLSVISSSQSTPPSPPISGNRSHYRSLSFNALSIASSSPVASPCQPTRQSLPRHITRSKHDIEMYLIALVSEKTGLPPSQISSSKNLLAYGMSSITVVWAAKKLSDYVGVHVAAIDIYSASSISELSDMALRLVSKAQCETSLTSSAAEPIEASLPVVSRANRLKRPDIEKFLIDLVAETSGVVRTNISVMEPLASYGINSTGVALAAQKLSNFLGTRVAAIDIYTCTCISELVDFSEALMKTTFPNEHPHNSKLSSQGSTIDVKEEVLHEIDMESALHPSVRRRVCITALQLLGILYIAAILLLPAIGVCSLLVKVVERGTWASIILAMSLIPVVELMYTVTLGATIALVAIPFLRPNYACDPCLPLWSWGFVKWWTLYRLQDFASKIVVEKLRGSVFMAWWYRAMGARIEGNPILDTINVTDPALVSIGRKAIVAQGATLQGHTISQGIVRFKPLYVGSDAYVGPFSMVPLGAYVPATADLPPLRVANDDFCSFVTPSVHQQKTIEGSTMPMALRQLLGLYLVCLVPAVAAMLASPAFLWLSVNTFRLPKEAIFQTSLFDSRATCLLFPLSATFPWHFAGLTPLVIFGDNPHLLLRMLMELVTQGKALTLAVCFGGTYVTYGVLLSTITCVLKWCLIGKLKPKEDIAVNSNLGFRMWLVHRLIASTHVKFTMFLSGTEALCMYLRGLGAKVGYMVSVRGVGPLVDADLLDLHDYCHLGDFAKVITTMFTQKGTFYSQKVTIGSNSVVGAQSVVLPGTTLESQVLLGAMSVAKRGSLLREGGIYVGLENLVKVNKQLSSHGTITSEIEDITQHMEPSYQKVVAILAAHIAKTTLKVDARYFDQIGVVGKGTLRVLDKLPEDIPEHDIFSPGRTFPIIIRHSNSLSSDDDACGDARGLAMRILSSNDKENIEDALIDLTLKSGKAFYARTLVEFMSWLMGTREQRIEFVKRAPHIAKAVWTSLRQPNSYAELHYYSNTCCILRSVSPRSTEHYVRFCIRPADPRFGEDEGRVEPQDVLPPVTGMVARDPSDKRPLLFLADDFRKRLLSSEGVKYVLQLQVRPVSPNAKINEIALDCTQPWDEMLYPFKDVAIVHLDEVLDGEVGERLRFDPLNKTRTLDMVYVKSLTESGSIDHGRYLADAVAQHLRNGLPLRKEWRSMLNSVDLGKELLKEVPSEPALPNNVMDNGCPALSAAAIPCSGMSEACVTGFHSKREPSTTAITTAMMRPNQQGVQTKDTDGTRFLKLAVIRGVQPLLQTVLPITFMAAVMYPSILLLSFVGCRTGKEWLLALIPVAYMFSGFLLALVSIVCRWMLIGRTRQEDSSELWGSRILCDSTWQAIHGLLCESFLDLTRGSLLCVMYFNSLGASISMAGVYMDTLHVLNPDLLKVGVGSSIGRNALLFGHLYEGGRVLFNSIELEERSSVGTRALLLPGLRMKAGAHLKPLTLGMKDETIACY